MSSLRKRSGEKRKRQWRRRWILLLLVTAFQFYYSPFGFRCQLNFSPLFSNVVIKSQFRWKPSCTRTSWSLALWPGERWKRRRRPILALSRTRWIWTGDSAVFCLKDVIASFLWNAQILSAWNKLNIRTSGPFPPTNADRRGAGKSLRGKNCSQVSTGLQHISHLTVSSRTFNNTEILGEEDTVIEWTPSLRG